MSAQPTLADIKAMLQANVAALAQQLAPRGKRSGAWWMAHSPVRDDATPSFGVRLTGEAPGAWRDFATGDKGDVLQLIAFTNGMARNDVRGILAWARAWLGIDGAAPPAIAKRIADAKQEASARDVDAAKQAAENVKSAAKMFKASKIRPFVISPASLYLADRGIDVQALPRLPGALGWLPDVKHRESGTAWPVMTAAFTALDGATVAVHRTFLAQRRSSGSWTKAPVSPARKIWPSFKGAAIRLSRGASGLSIDKAAAQGLLETLVLVEGVEDGLSVALACPELRVWAAGSLGNLCEVLLPDCVDQVIVCADNDWGKPQAQAMLNRALARFQSLGRSVRVARSTVGKDVNDALIG